MGKDNISKRDSFKYWYRGICNILLTVAFTLPFVLLWYERLNYLLDRSYLNKGNLLMVGVYAILEVLFLCVFGGYKIGVARVSNMIISQALGLLGTNLVEIVITILIVGRVEHIGRIIGDYLLIYIIQVVLSVVLTYLFVKLYRRIFPPYRMLHIYGEHQNHLEQKMGTRGDKYVIAGEISSAVDLDEIEKAIQEYDAVLINDVSSNRRNKILKMCYAARKRVYFTPKISDILIRGAEELTIFDTPIYYSRNYQLSFGRRMAKRTVDIVFSLIGIILTSSIMLVTAIAIHAYDGGPVFYRQTRCTIDDKEFQIMKFRSMITDAEKDGKARLATENDDRITPVGKFIRATRIDELPQFFNVFKGDMSVVGPRPERPEIIREYCEEVPEFAYRTRVKAGLTGYAQIYGKYNTTSYDKLKLDMIYVQKNSMLLDLQLILLTFKVIFQKESTEGLEEGQETASTGNK